MKLAKMITSDDEIICCKKHNMKAITPKSQTKPPLTGKYDNYFGAGVESLTLQITLSAVIYGSVT